MKKLKSLTAYLVVFALLFSCDSNNEVEMTKQKADIYLDESGFLVFPNNDSFEKTATKLADWEFSKVKKWEDQLKFTSMRNVFEQGLKAEEELVNETSDRNVDAKTHSKFVINNLSSFKTLGNGILTTNIYRIDLAPLVNKDGIVKVGNIIFQYSYDYLKIIEDGDKSKIQLLNQVTETDKSLKIAVNKVERNVDRSSGARFSFYQRSSITVTDRETQYCKWEARLVAELTLATVNVPVYEQVERLCYDNEFNDKAYTCYETVVIRTDTRNYFEAFCYNEVEKGHCSWGGYGPDSRYQLMISGTYKQNGVSKSLYQISASPSSQLRHSIYNSTNTPNADIVDAAITFQDVNNPKPKSVFIGFN